MIINDEMLLCYQELKAKYVHDEASYREFKFYLNDFNQSIRIDMNDTAIHYRCKDHFKAAAENTGESRKTIWRATKM